MAKEANTKVIQQLYVYGTGLILLDTCGFTALFALLRCEGGSLRLLNHFPQIDKTGSKFALP